MRRLRLTSCRPTISSKTSWRSLAVSGCIRPLFTFPALQRGKTGRERERREGLPAVALILNLFVSAQRWWQRTRRSWSTSFSRSARTLITPRRPSSSIWPTGKRCVGACLRGSAAKCTKKSDWNKIHVSITYSIVTIRDDTQNDWCD